MWVKVTRGNTVSERVEEVLRVLPWKLMFATPRFGEARLFFTAIYGSFGDSAQRGGEFYVQRNSIGSF